MSWTPDCAVIHLLFVHVSCLNPLCMPRLSKNDICLFDHVLNVWTNLSVSLLSFNNPKAEMWKMNVCKFKQTKNEIVIESWCLTCKNELTVASSWYFVSTLEFVISNCVRSVLFAPLVYFALFHFVGRKKNGVNGFECFDLHLPPCCMGLAFGLIFTEALHRL